VSEQKKYYYQVNLPPDRNTYSSPREHPDATDYTLHEDNTLELLSDEGDVVAVYQSNAWLSFERVEDLSGDEPS